MALLERGDRVIFLCVFESLFAAAVTTDELSLHPVNWRALEMQRCYAVIVRYRLRTKTLGLVRQGRAALRTCIKLWPGE